VRRTIVGGLATCLVVTGAALVVRAVPAAAAADPPFAATSVYEQGHDDLRTSYYPEQTTLTPALVQGGTFGAQWTANLDDPGDGRGPDQVYTQPLIYRDPATGKGIVVVGTEADDVYGFDATTGARLYKRNLGHPFDPTNIEGLGGCADLTPRIGITSTGLIDDTGAAPVAYTVYKSADPNTNQASYTFEAYDPRSGAHLWSVAIAGQAANNGVLFDPSIQLNRASLLLMNGVVYMGFGSHCDIGPYRGWVVGINVATHSLQTMWASAASNFVGAGIWQAGGGVMTDGPGRLFVTTGNSNSGSLYGSTPLAETNPPQNNLTEAVLRLEVQSDGTLAPKNFFAPYDATVLDDNDLDFASGGPVGLPDNVLPVALQHQNRKLVAAVGKEGYVYLLDRDHLGGYNPAGDNAVYRSNQDGGAWSKPAVWPGGDNTGGYVYVLTSTPPSQVSAGGINGFLDAYKISSTPSGAPALGPVARSQGQFGFSSGSPIVTSVNGTAGTGVVWVIWAQDTTGAAAELRAYDAIPAGDGSLTEIGHWPIGLASKFVAPSASGNWIFVPTRSGTVKAFGAPINTPLSAASPQFSSTPVGTPETRNVVLTANQSLTVTGVTVSGTYFTAGTPSPPVGSSLTQGQKLTVPVIFDPQAPGTKGGSLTVTTSAGSYSLSFQATGLASGPALNVFPGALSLGGAVSGGSPLVGTLQLTNVGSQPLQVSAITLATGGTPFQLSSGGNFSIASNSTTAVTVTFFPPNVGAPTSYSNTIKVVSNGGSASIPVTASAAPPGHRTLSPTTVSYPTTLTGGRRLGGFTIGNNGQSTYAVTVSKPPVGGSFTANPGSLSEGTPIAPGAGNNRFVPVQFTPTLPGLTLTDHWTINTSEGSGKTAVTFTGTSLPSAGLPAPASGTWWFLNGATSISGGIQLNAQATAGSNGSVWYRTPVSTSRLETRFTAFLDGDNGSGQFADGLTFSLVDASAGTSALGDGVVGGNLGFGTIPGSHNLAVALVTFDGGVSGQSLVGLLGSYGDDTKAWVSGPDTVGTAGPIHGATAGARPVPVDVWVDPGASGTSLVSVAVDDTLVIDRAQVTLPPRAYVGFTAGTGGLSERHAVTGVSIRTPVAAKPGVRLSAASMNFGRVPVGELMTKPLTVVNTGNVALAVQPAGVPAGFKVAGLGAKGLPVLVAPGRSITGQVGFVPNANGTITGKLSLSTTTAGTVGVMLSGVGIGAGSGAPTPFESLAPFRILDTREGLGGRGPLQPGGVMHVKVTGVGGVPASGVSAVMINVTATNTTAPGYFTVYPTGQAPPTASNLNFVAGQSIANLVTAKVGVGGSIDIFNYAGTDDAVFDIVGYFPTAGAAERLGAGIGASGGQLVPLTPARILDTRVGIGGVRAPLGTNGSLSFPVTGVGGVPAAGVSAVVLNVTATNTSAPGYLTVWPAGNARPTASNLDFTAGQSVPNLVVAKVGSGGRVSVFNYSGATDVVADVMGWFTAPGTSGGAAGSLFHALAPARILDTRAGIGSPPAALGPGGTLTLHVAGAGGVPPAGALGAVLNVTATNTTVASFLTVWPSGVPMPTASNLDFVAGQTVPNLVIGKLGPGGTVEIYNFAGSTDVVADVVGWFG
jgi:hypothetical protein